MKQYNTETIGMDMGDKRSHIFVLDNATGDELEQASTTTTVNSLKRWFSKREKATVVIEVGSDSGWVSRLLTEIGHEVLVADSRKVRRLAGNDEKDDPLDAEFLARIGRMDRNLLKPIKLRSQETQSALGVIRSRNNLVKARTQLINHVRGTVKTVGERLSTCSAQSFCRLEKEIPKALQQILHPTMLCIKQLTEQIKCYEKLIEAKAEHEYRETDQLIQVRGVGALTALAFVLTIEDPHRFSNSRQVGAYLGLTRRKYKSGASDPELRISKQGDALLRRLLVNCVHYILGPFGPDSDLRRWGLNYIKGGGKNAKKRAVVAVARKLAVLLHRLWVTGEQYEPLRNSNRCQPAVV